LGEEQFAEKDDSALMARMNFKKAVTKIIVRIQAYKLNNQIKRTQDCRCKISKVLPMMPELQAEDDSEFGESYCTEDESIDKDSLDPDMVVQSEIENKLPFGAINARPFRSNVTSAANQSR
jgi:hypothetical protein